MQFELSTPSEIGSELGQRLRAQRLQQNLQQAELAARAGVSEGTVRNLETKGQGTLESLLRIVIALGLVGEMADLFIARPTSIKALREQSAVRTRASRARR
jgi:transcriptional regulator with XRE-family HTH domain